MSKQHQTHSAKKGFTLTEMLISLMVAGIFAVLMIPKVMISPEERDAQVKTQVSNMLKQQLNLSLLTYKSQNNLDDQQLRSDIGAGLATLGDIFYFYGNFFSYKNVSGRRYFYFANKARLSFDLTYFSVGDYDAASIPQAIEDICTAQATAGTGYCAAVDVNGRSGRNTYGDTGDIVVFLINTNNFTASEFDSNPPAAAIPSGFSCPPGQEPFITPGGLGVACAVEEP